MAYKGKFDEVVYEKMVLLYGSGLSTTQIGARYNVNCGSVHDVLKKRGVVFRSRSESKRKYNLNESKFDCIDSCESAYWLGFLLADGCVVGKDVVLQLKEEDKNHLELFNFFLESNYPIRHREKTKSYRIDIRSDRLSNSLISQGCIPRKSLRLEFPNTIPAYYSSLIRGYFDGDGTIFYSNGNTIVSFAGTEDFLTSVREIIKEETNANGSIKKHNKSNVYYLTYSGSFQAESVCQYLYQDCTICLKRKHDLFVGMKKGRSSHPFRSRYIFANDL
jgi:LAGLIDADG-like domain